MNLRLLSIGASAYGALIVLTLTSAWVYIPETTAIIPSLLLATVGITTTALGLIVKGRAGFNRVGVLMVSGFLLGVFGFISWFDASTDSYHVADVCAVSKFYPDGGEWACPQVQASNQIMWIVAVSLVILTLLFFVAPYLSLRQEHKLRQTPENPQVVSTNPQTPTS